jgi:hypothetical protein
VEQDYCKEHRGEVQGEVDRHLRQKTKDKRQKAILITDFIYFTDLQTMLSFTFLNDVIFFTLNSDYQNFICKFATGFLKPNVRLQNTLRDEFNECC